MKEKQGPEEKKPRNLRPQALTHIYMFIVSDYTMHAHLG